MRNVVRIFLGILCGAVIVVCIFIGFVSESRMQLMVMKNLDGTVGLEHVLMEDYSARVVDAAPEDYCLYTGKEISREDYKVVEFTCYFTNDMNHSLNKDSILVTYHRTDGGYLPSMAPGEGTERYYWNNLDHELLPAGESIFYKGYAAVPKELNEMEVFYCFSMSDEAKSVSVSF